MLPILQCSILHKDQTGHEYTVELHRFTNRLILSELHTTELVSVS